MKTETQLIMTEKCHQVSIPTYMIGGAIAWLIGVIFIRFAGTMFFKEGSLWLVGVYLLAIPVAWSFIKVFTIAGNLSGMQIVMAVVTANFTATCMDGMAIAWFPSLYGLPTHIHLLATAWLLWFVGVSLGLSLIITSTD